MKMSLKSAQRAVLRMFELISQAKGYLRGSIDKWSALTDIALETESAEVFRFTENVRWLYGIQDRRALGQNSGVSCCGSRRDSGDIQKEA
jgi:hypothetical protein